MPLTQSHPLWAKRVANWVLDHRLVTLIFIVVTTMGLGIALPQIEIYSRFADLLPQEHPYIQTYNRMAETFGGANVVTMSLEVKEGDIFTQKTLETLRSITLALDRMSGVNHYQISSLAHPKIRRVMTTPLGLIKSQPVLPKDIPDDPADLKRLREDMFNNDIVYGTYLSQDGKAALILAGFHEARLDYHKIFSRLQTLKTDVEADGDMQLFIAGEPMLKGWVYHYAGQLTMTFAVTLGIMAVLFYLYFQSLTGVLIPLVGMSVSAVWGLGLVGWLGFNLDPLILVVPVLISARTASHCVQLMARYQEELPRVTNSNEAVRTSMAGLLTPASIAIFTDSAGLLVLTVSSIPVIAKLGLFCAFWSLSNLVTVTLLVPILLTVLPVPKQPSVSNGSKLITRAMARWASYITSPVSSVPVFGVVLVLIGIGGWYAKDGIVGDNAPGSPILFHDSEYNQAAKRINQRFAGPNQLSIYFESSTPHRMKNPDVLRVMEGLAQHMSTIPSYGGIRATSGLIRSINRLYHYDDPRWAILPNTPRDVGNMLFMYEAGAADPGVMLEYMNLEASLAHVVVFFQDTTGATIEQALHTAKTYLQAHPLEDVEYRFAGGIIGTLAATNEEVARSELLQTFLIIGVVIVTIGLVYRSIWAAGLVFVVLALAVLGNRAYMGLRGIGLTIHSLPVMAVGIGIGVDYAIYFLDRVRQDIKTHPLSQAIQHALTTTGNAILFTALTIVCGVLYWIPGSPLRFNSEMAMLLGLLMISNMVGTITVLPLLVRLFEPRFIVVGSSRETTQDVMPSQSTVTRNENQAEHPFHLSHTSQNRIPMEPNSIGTFSDIKKEIDQEIEKPCPSPREKERR